MKRIGILITLLVLIIPFVQSSVNADGCLFVPTGFSVYEPGQNAIIAWNGQEETMILSVDVYSNSGNTKAVHVVPFPSLPEYTLSDAEMFYKIQWPMTERSGYRSYKPDLWDLMYEYTLSAGNTDGIDILSHEQIGPHDITVTKVSTSYEFRNWANTYFKTHELDNIELPENTRDVIDFYLLKGYQYFVFDVIDIEEDRRSVDPLAYTFETSMPYFPLKISSLLTGHATIDLAFITPKDLVFDYKALEEIGFTCESTNLWAKASVESFNKTIADMFEDDTILEHFRVEHLDLNTLDCDVELNLVHTIWQKAETNYIYTPIKGDFNQDGIKDILYFNGDGIVLLDPYTGNEIWFADISWYPNYYDINYFDMNSDGIDEIIIYDNSYLYIINLINGKILLKIDIEMMQFYKIVENETMYIYDAFSIIKIDLVSFKTEWKCILDATYEYYYSIWDFYDYVERMYGIQYYELDHVDNFYKTETCYYHFYYPFDPEIFTYCDIFKDNYQELLIVFRNTTCLIDDELGMLVWQTVIHNDLINENQIKSISLIDDSDNDSYQEILVETLKEDVYLSGKNGSKITNITSTNKSKSGSNYKSSDNSENGQVFTDDFDGDGIKDYVIYKKYEYWEDDYRKVSYTIYFSRKNVWIINQTIKLDILHGARLIEILVKNSTIIFRFDRQVFGVDILLNEVLWKLDLGVPIYLFDLVNTDDDLNNEIVLCTDNKIFSMDIPPLKIPPKDNTSANLGPFTYDDGETPIENATVYIENEEGLVLVSETNETGELAIEINPDKYQCSLKIGDEIYIDYFNVTISDQGMVGYGTEDGDIPSSAKSAPENNNKIEDVKINVYLSILIIIIIIVIFIEFLFIKPKKNR